MILKYKLLLLLLVCGVTLQAQNIPSIRATDVEGLSRSKDTVYVYHFWATWCLPCVQELPEYNEVYRYFEKSPVCLRLISLDYKQDYPMRLAQFVMRKKVLPPVMWLNETNSNYFVPKIDERWEGSLPATFIVQPGKYRKFVEGQASATQIIGLINPLLVTEE